jgi:hypothetical protein
MAARLLDVLVALFLGIPSFVTAWYTIRSHKVVKDVQAQVTTINNQTAAQLLDANETRRIEAVPLEERSKTDRSHMRSVEEHEEGH